MLTNAFSCIAAAALAAGVGGSPAGVGLWEPPIPWDVIAIHAAMLPSGKVLHYSYPQGGDLSRARLWDPVTGEFTPVDMAPNLFCSGMSLLPDGSLYVTGGTGAACENQGLTVTNAFDPFTETWTPLGLMADGRWYPTNIPLGDGSVAILSGRSLVCHSNPLVELFTPGKGLQLVPGAERSMSLFPRAHLLSSGLIAHVGEEAQTYTLDLSVPQWLLVAFSDFGIRCQGTSVLVPGFEDRIMIVGGNCPLTGTAEIIDLAGPEPQWRFTGSLNHPRAHADALVLPDATVLLVGGGVEGFYGGPVLIPELYDPQAESWTEMAPHTYGRMYHATTVLLPDGRVLAAGQDAGGSQFFGEIYHPPYLFGGPRPVLEAAPPRLGYGWSISVATPQADDIASAALIAPSAVTHSINTTQRYVGLAVEVVGPGVLRVTAPAAGNHAPPGFYMLFLVDGNGVPSVAPFVHVGPWLSGDLDGDGIVGVTDLLVLLGSWGGCAGCQSDLDGDGVAGIGDLVLLLSGWT